MKKENIIAQAELLKDEFLKNNYWDVLLPFSSEYETKRGYTNIVVNKDLTIENISFIEGGFAKGKFKRVTINYSLNPYNDKVVSAHNSYFVLQNKKTGITIRFCKTWITLKILKENELKKRQQTLFNAGTGK